MSGLPCCVSAVGTRQVPPLLSTLVLSMSLPPPRDMLLSMQTADLTVGCEKAVGRKCTS